MTDAIETIEYKGHTIKIYQDENPISPREWDNICEFHCSHRKYNLGDKEFNYHDGQDCIEAITERKRNGDLVLPLYMYDHSGITISLCTFYGRLSQGHAEFDSGIVGFVVVPRKKMLEEFGKKLFTPKLKEKALEIAQNEVDTYDQYLRGDVYGYVIDDGDGDSCWGYYGDIKYAIEAAEETIDYMIKNAIKKHCEKVKAWILNKVSLNCRTGLST